MKVQTSELTGAALDWAVTMARFGRQSMAEFFAFRNVRLGLSPSTNWAIGGPLIERNKIALNYFHDELHENGGEWLAECEGKYKIVEQPGPTALIAAMRCYVTAKLGKEVEVPEELFDNQKASRVNAGIHDNLLRR